MMSLAQELADLVKLRNESQQRLKLLDMTLHPERYKTVLGPSSFEPLESESEQEWTERIEGEIDIEKAKLAHSKSRIEEILKQKPEPNTENAHTAAQGSSGATASGERLVRSFPTPYGSTWSDIVIRFTSDFQVQIRARDQTEVRTYIEMGFEDRRKGNRRSKPDGNWEILKKFAELNGKIHATERADNWKKLEKSVQEINKRLKGLFGFNDRPITYEGLSKAYRTRFKIIFPRN
jgi:hypothetical protein